MIASTIAKKCRDKKIIQLKRCRDDSPINDKKCKIKKNNNNSKHWNKLLNINVDSNIWVSATRTANYLMKDPLIDWLEKYHKNGNSNSDSNFNNNINNSNNNSNNSNNNNNTNNNSNNNNSNNNINELKGDVNILFHMGNKFENTIVNEIRKLYPDSVKKVCVDFKDVFNRDKSIDTYNYMKQGIPIIEQAMLINDLNKTFGVADLLIRSDYINKLFKKEILEPDDLLIQANKLSGKYHYVVIDIKWSHIPLAANGKTILNKDRYVAYKGQLAIYNLALGIMQDYIPKKAYILGKGYTVNSKNTYDESYDCFDRLAEIHYCDNDIEYIEFTAQAVDWIRELECSGAEWDCMKPHRKELYPNMCVENYKWNNMKKNIAKELKELTQLWMIGYDNRERAHKNNVFSWNDPNCNSKVLNVTKTRAIIIDKLLEVNRSDNKLIYPAYIKNNMCDWQHKKSYDFFIDFETLNECFVDTDINLANSKKNTNVIYMIGISYVDYDNGKSEYKSFVMNSFELVEEKKILTEFMQFIKNKMCDSKNVKPRLFHWSKAEHNFLKGADRRHGGFMTQWFGDIEMVDINKIFYDEPIVVKNMMSFKLKDVAISMHKLGMIGSKWDDMDSGDIVIRESSKYYREKKYNNVDKKDIINNIINYNKVDCDVLMEIVDYLRINHCSNE